MKRQPLGRGLDAILGGGSSEPVRTEINLEKRAADQSAQRAASISAHDSSPRLLPIEQIVAGRGQPRRKFAEEPLEELAQSIREKGIIQPLVVTEGPAGFELIAGERRLRAAARAGLERVPVIIKRDVAHDELLELALIENIQREDLTPMEEARAFQRLLDDHGYTQEVLGKRLGKSRAAVSNTLRLLGLPDAVQQLVEGDQLSEGHARALLRFGSAAEQIRLARRCVQEGLSVRQIEELAKRRAEGAGQASKPGKTGSASNDPLAEQLTKTLATRVRVKRLGQGGSLEISYHSQEELTRLVDRICS